MGDFFIIVSNQIFKSCVIFSKLSFSLNAHLFEISENSCEVQLLFEGDFNPMMAMMVKKPLTNFIDTLTQNIAKL